MTRAHPSSTGVSSQHIYATHASVTSRRVNVQGNVVARENQQLKQKNNHATGRARNQASSRVKASQHTSLTGLRSPSLFARSKHGRLHARQFARSLVCHSGNIVKQVVPRVSRSTLLDLFDQDDEDQENTLSTRLEADVMRATRLTSRVSTRGVTSSARFLFRHRHAPKKLIKTSVRAAKQSVRVARVSAQIIRRMIQAVVSAIVSAVSAISMPIIAVIVAILAVIMVIMSFFSIFFSSPHHEDATSVPQEYVSDVRRAGNLCEQITPSIIAAQIEAESGWNSRAQSPAGAQGIAQFMPLTWASVGHDGDGDKIADVLNAHDAIYSQGIYMCRLANQIDEAKRNGRLIGDTVELTLAAYNAGIGSVLRYQGVPPFLETLMYVNRIMGLAQDKYASESMRAEASAGGVVQVGADGTLNPPLVMQDGMHVNITRMGLGFYPIPDYDVYQCTWWAAMRRKQIGKPVDSHMGNGGQWDDTAHRLGYPVSKTAFPGDVMVFEAGVLGSSLAYGHVAVVEQVNPDGSILISQSGTGWMAVVTQTISRAQLQANVRGISFIH